MLGDPIYNPDTMYPVDLIGVLGVTDRIAAEQAYRERTGYSGPINWTWKRPDQTDQEAFELYYLGTPAERRQAAANRRRHARAVARSARRAEAEAKKRRLAQANTVTARTLNSLALHQPQRFVGALFVGCHRARDHSIPTRQGSNSEHHPSGV